MRRRREEGWRSKKQRKMAGNGKRDPRKMKKMLKIRKGGKKERKWRKRRRKTLRRWTR